MTTLEKMRAEIADNHDYYFFAESNKDIALGLEFALEIIDKYAEQEQTGHWIMNRKFERRTCDNCNKEYRWSFYPHNYCQSCGARMDSKQDE